MGPASGIQQTMIGDQLKRTIQSQLLQKILGSKGQGGQPGPSQAAARWRRSGCLPHDHYRGLEAHATTAASTQGEPVMNKLILAAAFFREASSLPSAAAIQVTVAEHRLRFSTRASPSRPKARPAAASGFEQFFGVHASRRERHVTVSMSDSATGGGRIVGGVLSSMTSRRPRRPRLSSRSAL